MSFDRFCDAPCRIKVTEWLASLSFDGDKRFGVTALRVRLLCRSAIVAWNPDSASAGRHTAKETEALVTRGWRPRVLGSRGVPEDGMEILLHVREHVAAPVFIHAEEQEGDQSRDNP